MSADITSRRATLAGAIATIVAPAAILPATAKPGLPTHPDAPLLSLLAEFNALEVQVLSYYSGGARYIADDDEREPIIAPLQEIQDALLGPICVARASTAEGVAARARTLAQYAPDRVMASPNGYHDDRMIAALLRDAMELGA